MAVFLLIIAALLGSASYTAFSAADNVARAATPNWAVRVCSQNPLFCQYPQQMAYAAVALAALAVVATVVSYRRNRLPEETTVTLDRISNLGRRR